MGWSMWRSHTTKAAEDDDRPGQSAENERRGPRPVGRLDDPPQQQTDPDDRQDRAHRIGPLGVGVLRVGHEKCVATRPITAMGTLTRKTDPHQKWARRNPPSIGPMATPSPVVPDQIPIARARSRSPVNTLVRIDKVEGMRAAAPTPMTARAAMSRSGVSGQAAMADPAPKTTSPAMNTHLRPTRSPSAPEREQQTGEDDGIGVDDPLQLGRRRMQAADDRRQSDVQDRVVEADEQQGHTQDSQRGSTPVVGHAGALDLPPPRRVGVLKACWVGDHHPARADPRVSPRPRMGAATGEPPRIR